MTVAIGEAVNSGPGRRQTALLISLLYVVTEKRKTVEKPELT